MVPESEHPFHLFRHHRPPAPKFCNTSFTDRMFSDVAGDITVVVDGESFLLHKFPLVSGSGKISKMLADDKYSKISKIELMDVPGGPQTFKLAAKFSYGINFEIKVTNIANLRCAAEYLEMTEDYKEQNLIQKTESYLTDFVFKNLETSVQVLTSCETLPSLAEELGIQNRSVDAIAMNACKEQLASGLSRLDCKDESTKVLKNDCTEWWVQELSVLRIDYFQRVISAMNRNGVHRDSIIASLMHYAHTSLKGIEKSQMWNPAKTKTVENDQRRIVETLVSLMPMEKCSYTIPLSFLFGMLRMAIMVDATVACKIEIERRIGFRMELISLDDLLIPSVHAGDSLFDVDTVLRILVHFLQRVEEEDNYENGYESDAIGSPNHASALKVGRLIDSYLAEIAPDTHLSLHKFIDLIEMLPDYARVIDDELYRAIDIYLKAHPMLTENEIKKLCKFIDCQKLSQEASNHAAQNGRLPVQMTVQVLYFEQLRLRDAVSASSGDTFLSQRISSGIPSAAMSPKDNYASLRRENKELKLEISRMRVRVSDLEKEQAFMKQGMMGKSVNEKTFFTSLSKGIGRIGIFSSQTGGKRQKGVRTARVSEGKTGRSRRCSVS